MAFYRSNKNTLEYRKQEKEMEAMMKRKKKTEKKDTVKKKTKKNKKYPVQGC